ncbi:MAG: ParB N-terminal domain-containing protein [Nanoarchaeota archaeon]|nr:ParB N-terminal domain-containing protein [Nanoarchaeota archaeon]
MLKPHIDEIVHNIPLNLIDLRYNYRTPKHNKDYISLRESIGKEGLLKPILLRKRKRRYELIAGQRRYLAHIDLKRETIPSMIFHDIDELRFLEIQLIENTQRKIRPYETAQSLWDFYLTILENKMKDCVLDRNVSYYAREFKGREHFNMEEFSQELNLSPNIVRTAFLYIHTLDIIKKLVEGGKLHYTSAAEVGRLQTHDEQEAFIFSEQARRKDGGFYSSKYMAKRVTEIIRSKEVCEELRLSNEKLDPAKLARIFLMGGEKGKEFNVYNYFINADHFLKGTQMVLEFEREEGILEFNGMIKKNSGLINKVIEEDIDFENKIRNKNSGLLEKIIKELSPKVGFRESIMAKAFGKSDQIGRLIDSYDIRELPIEDCIIDKTNLRMTYDEDHIAILAKSMEILGQLTPVIVRPKNGKYIISTGNCRKKAAELAGLTKLKAFVIEMDELTAKAIQFVEDYFEKPPIYETAQAIHNALSIEKDIDKVKTEDISSDDLFQFEKKREFGGGEFIKRYMNSYGKGKIQNALKFIGLDDKTKSLVEIGIISYSVALELAGITIKDGEDFLDQRYYFAIASLLNNESIIEVRERMKNRNQNVLNLEEESISTLARRSLNLKFTKYLQGIDKVYQYILKSFDGSGICLENERFIKYFEILKINLEKLSQFLENN